MAATNSQNIYEDGGAESGRRPELVALRTVPAPWALPVDELPVPDGSRHASFYVRVVKRALDVVVASLALLVALPVIVVLAAAVRITMGGPVFFRQVRIGRGGTPFEVLKLRTMRPDRRRSEGTYTGPDRRRTHKPARHPLMTPLGRLLRTYSLDEFPQLLNVLRGDMSLVGPRPELPSVTWAYEPWQHARMLVRPGLTGLWQITARGHAPMHERTDLDIEYVRRVSIGTDLRILAATPRAMLGEHKGH